MPEKNLMLLELESKPVHTTGFPSKPGSTTVLKKASKKAKLVLKNRKIFIQYVTLESETKRFKNSQPAFGVLA